MRRGFSLVELSIVLVILGLLVGGILSGQSLIRAAELRSVTTQYNKYVAAVQTFRDKYFALPGDMANAQSFWGIAHATPATCVTTASSTTATCNGDGNGSISGSAAGSNEMYRFWQHLANAGLIEGQYDGISHGAGLYGTTTANAPSGRISSSLWHVRDIGTVSASTLFDGVYGNTFEFGAVKLNDNSVNPLFKTEELWNIDTKIDDGKAATGKLVVYSTLGLSTCTTTVANNSATLTADYLLTNTTIACAAEFRQQF